MKGRWRTLRSRGIGCDREDLVTLLQGVETRRITGGILSRKGRIGEGTLP